MQSKEDERKQAPWKCGNEKCNYLRSRSITGYFQEHLPSLKVQFPEVIIFPTFAGEIPECIFEEKFWETFLKRGYLDQIKRSMSVPVLLLFCFATFPFCQKLDLQVSRFLPYAANKTIFNNQNCYFESNAQWIKLPILSSTHSLSFQPLLAFVGCFSTGLFLIWT